MKFTCLQENLSQGISHVGHIALKATSLPILTNIHLVAEQGVLSLSATNLESGVRAIVRGKIEDDGECLVPARLLLDLIPLLDTGPLTGELTQEGLTITTQHAVTTLRVHPTADFPIIPSIDEVTSQVSVHRELFVAALNRVSIAAGRVENKPQFNGILMVVSGTRFTLVATDGFRLAEAVVSLGKAGKDVRAIIPLAAAQECARILSSVDDEPEATLLFAENQIKVETESCFLVSRLIEGEYPDYVPLFPMNAATKGIVEAGVLAKALKASTLFSRAGVAGVALEVNPEHRELRISSENGDVGAHQTTLPLKGEGVDVRVVANARFILDALSGLGSDAVLEIAGADRPLLITPEKSGSVSFRYLVMPIRQ